MTTTLFSAMFAALLAAPPASPAATATATATAKPVATATPAPAAKPAGFEMTISEALIGAMVSAMMPYDTMVEQEVGALGITRTIQVNVHLSNPRTKITPAGIVVTLDYTTDGAFAKSGTATPTMTLTPIPSKQIIEGKLSRSGVMLPGGIELPIEDLVEPIEIPAVIPQKIEAGDKTIAAEARLTEVILEEGRIRVRGDATFKPAK